MLAPKLAVLLDDPTDRGLAPGASTAWQGLRGIARRGEPDAGPGGQRRGPAALGRKGCAVEWLALERGFDWWGADLREERGRFRFRAFCKGRFVTEAAAPGSGPRGTC